MFRVAIVFLFGIMITPLLANETGSGEDGMLLPRGVVRATQQATIAVEFSAPVAKVNFREGNAFRKGDLLIGFDCRKQQAEHAAAKAQNREAELILKNNAYLRKRGGAGQHDIEVSKARVAKAAAEAEALALRLEQCTINAPFDGSVVELKVFEHELPAPGKPFLKIVGANALEVELIVPSKWLVWLKQGEPFGYYIEETAKTYDATVTRIATAVDPVSQTVKIFASLDIADGVLPGMSGIASFPRAERLQE